NLANRADLAIGDVKELAVGRQAARLGEAGEARQSIEYVLAAVAGEVRQFLLGWVEIPNLVVAGHRDEQPVADHQEAPRAVEADAGRRYRAGNSPIAGFRLLPRAGDCTDLLPLQVDGPDGVVLAIGHVKDVALEGEPLRIVELGLVE